MRKLFLALLFAPVPLLAQHVRDARASLFDVPAQQQLFVAHPELRATVGKVESCLKLPPVAAPTGRMLIPHHYLKGSNGPVDPAEAEATRVYGAFEHRITGGMNQYVLNGSHAESGCALAQLDDWAKADALYNYDRDESSQAWYQSEWTLSSAGVSFSVLINDPAIDPAQKARVGAWLQKAIKKNIAFERPGKDNNNHHYWRALAAASIGVSTADDGLLRFAVDAYKGAIAEIDSRGAFPLEMARHENAIHYQCFALQPLILVAQYASRQNVDLYTYSVHGHTIRDAILFFGRAATDPKLVEPYTSDEQHLGFGAGDYAAFAWYVKRPEAAGLPTDLVAATLRPSISTRIGGNTRVLTAIQMSPVRLGKPIAPAETYPPAEPK